MFSNIISFLGTRRAVLLTGACTFCRNWIANFSPSAFHPEHRILLVLLFPVPVLAAACVVMVIAFGGFISTSRSAMPAEYPDGHRTLRGDTQHTRRPRAMALAATTTDPDPARPV